jgi:hypothetical protein
VEQVSSTSAVAVLAQGLRELRDFAEGPDGEELRERTGLTTTQIDAALGGERLPTREVTLALVEAWEGDAEAWREYWGQISELAKEDDGEGAATPAPPEPSIIVPMEEEPDGDRADDVAEGEAAGSEAEAEAGVEAEVEAEAARARSAARAQLEANAQAAKAHSEAIAAAAADGEAPGRTGDADDEEVETARAGGPDAAESKSAAEAEEPARAEGSADATEMKAAAERASRPGIEAAAASQGANASKHATVLQPTAVVPGGNTTRPPAKKRLLARIGIPILLFAIGVGAGAFGDHALSSKQNSKNTSASVPPLSATSSPSRSSGSAALSAGTTSSSGPTYTASSPSSNPTASTSATGGSASATSTVAPGTVLGTYVGVQLASGYSVNFLADPYHPAAGTANGPDTMGFFAGSFVDGRFYADRVALLDPTDTGSFTSCLNDTRYQHDVLLAQLSTSSSFCITTGTGHLVLVTVRRLPSSTDANPYAVVDVTVWQGS